MTIGARRAAVAGACALAAMVVGGLVAWPRLLERADLAAIAGASELHVDWSHDPRTGLVAFAHDSGEPGLFLLDTRRGGPPRRLAVTEPWPRRPVLAPGGRALLYHDLNPLAGDDWATHRAYLLDVATGRSRLLVDGREDAHVIHEAFSPDADRVAYELVRKQGGWRTEVRQRTLSSDADELLFTQAEPANPRFAADGRALYFVRGGCVERYELATRRAERLACAPEGKPTDAPIIPSADERSLAVTLETADCPAVATARAGDAALRFVDRAACTLRPAWLAPTRLAFVEVARSSRLPTVRRLDDGVETVLGPPLQVAYQLAAEPDGQLLALLGRPGAPRTIWRLDPSAPGREQLLHSPLDPGVVRRATPRVDSARVVSSDGVEVPIWIFRPEAPPTRAPAVLWVHGGHGGGKADVSPRWTNELAYLVRLGCVVVAVNYRGSTGYGGRYRAHAGDVEGQGRDLRAADAYLRALPDVDLDRVFVFAESWGGVPAAQLLAHPAPRYRGIVQWSGAAFAEQALTRMTGPPAPILWIHGRWNQGADGYPALEAALRARGASVERVELPGASHVFLRGDERAIALDAVRRLVR